jgi:hypothetical protein
MAAAASRRLLKELPTEDEMGAIITDLRAQSPHALAVMSVAYLEHALERVLKARITSLTKTDERRLFDGASNGIIGTFSAKVRIGYAFGFLGPISYSDLLLINDIRNVFAHSLHTVDFSNKLISDDCIKLRSYDNLIRIMGGSPPSANEPSFMFSESVFMLYIGMLNQLIIILGLTNDEDYTLDGVLRRISSIVR